MRTLTVAALNIVMPAPHTEKRYIELFKSALALNHVVRLRANFSGMLGSVHIDKDGNDGSVLTGEFYKFFDLDLGGQWFNLLEQKPAEKEELSQIFVPQHLKPHFQFFPFLFFPREHRLFFVSRDQKDNLSPGQTQKLVSDIFDREALVRRFGEIEVTVEPSQESLQRIFNMPRLTWLLIEVTPPNPDDLQAAENKLFEKMENQRADKLKLELVSKDSDGLSPDEDTKILAEIAKSNGKVVGHGEDNNGQTVDVSTVNHPRLERAEYDPKLTTRASTLLEKSREILNQIARRR